MPQSNVCKNLNAVWFKMGELVNDDAILDLIDTSAGRKVEGVLKTLEGLMDRNGCEYPATRAIAAMERAGVTGLRRGRLTPFEEE